MGETPDDESITRFERYEAALKRLAAESPHNHSLRQLASDTSMMSLRRQAIINGAINYDRKVLERMNMAFPGVDLVDLAEKIRTMVVIMRLDGET